MKLAVVGGGSTYTPELVDGVAEAVVAVAPRANVTVVSSPPVVGAALLALDQIGADDAAKARAREDLDAAVDGRLAMEAPDG